MENNGLKPCPFCGSEAKFIGDSISIKCPKCGCAFIATNPLLTRMDVADYWNKRTHGRKTEEQKVADTLHRQDLRHVAGMVPGVLRRLDAAVFTVIDPALAKEAANIIRLQRELLEGKEGGWHGKD